MRIFRVRNHDGARNVKLEYTLSTLVPFPRLYLQLVCGQGNTSIVVEFMTIQLLYKGGRIVPESTKTPSRTLCYPFDVTKNRYY